jgi:hypothetical protein
VVKCVRVLSWHKSPEHSRFYGSCQVTKSTISLSSFLLLGHEYNLEVAGHELIWAQQPREDSDGLFIVVHDDLAPPVAVAKQLFGRAERGGGGGREVQRRVRRRPVRLKGGELRVKNQFVERNFAIKITYLCWRVATF